ncbi:hypothetical protein, partial [Parabacteroides johnsonii]|uniref:hypothetical protein n=1 Tax=Parabacteroides johnsonii TaxID=387661 RepID=UPI00267325D5
PFSVSAFSIKLLPERTSREERISSCGRCIGLVGGKCFFGGLLVGEYFGGIIGDFLGRMWNNSTYMDCDLGNKQFYIGYIVLRTSYIMFFNA